MLRRATWATVVIGVMLGLLISPGVALADGPANITHCSASNPTLHLRWVATSKTWSRPDAWDASYRNALANSAADFVNNSDFDWNRVASGGIVWGDWNDPNDPGLAGVTVSGYDTSTCRFTLMAFFFNFPHFGGHTQDQKQCTSVHEFGHGVGLSHLYSGLYVMNYDHTYRCHTNNVKDLTLTDRNAVNFLY